MTDKKFTAAEAAQLVLEALKVKAKGALEKAQKGRAVKKQVAPAGIDPARQALSDYITPPQPPTSDASKMTFPKLDTPWTGRYPKGDARNDMGPRSGEDHDTYVNRTFGAGTAERGRKFFDAGMDQDIKEMKNPSKAPAAPKAPTAPKPPKSTGPEPLDWSEEKPEGTASGEASASKEEVSEPLAKRPSHEWNWQEPEAGLDVEGLDREHTGYAHATDEGGYHVARVNPVKGGFNFTHSHTAPGGEEKVVHASSSFKTPHEAHAHLREYTGAK